MSDLTDQGPIRLGMVGGGQGAFIGSVHRIAARMDNRFALVAGALSSDPEKAASSGAELGLAPERVYADWAEMARQEAGRSDGIEAVAIVTPNHLHAGPAIEFLSRGIHVICDKPLAATVPQAQALAQAARASNATFILTHTYAGYPMVRQARAMVAAGEIGTVRMVQVEYVQDWLTEASEAGAALWRADPAKAGGGAIGDIGTHAFHLCTYVSGLVPEALAADLSSFVPDRRVDDNAHVLLRFAGGAKGMLWASQVAPGNENTIRVRVYGDKGGLEWSHQRPGELWFTRHGEPSQRLTQNGAASWEAGSRLARVPAGHPVGYLEAFANLYTEAARVIRAAQGGQAVPPGTEAPGLADGLAGMNFIAACQKSSGMDAAWMPL